MNEKIQELWEQAAKTTQGDSWEEQTKFMEKFAELIVRECVEVCRRGKYDGREDMSLIQFNNGIRFCINAIDEHFELEIEL